MSALRLAGAGSVCIECKPYDDGKVKRRPYRPAKGPDLAVSTLHKFVTFVRVKTFFCSFCRAILRPLMTRTVKTFLIWLLMALLPLHAVAASIGMSCALVGQQVPHHAAGQAAHHAPAADAHAHHGADAASSLDQAAPDDGGAQAQSAKQPHSSCSACSSFCAGAVAPPSALQSLPSFGGSTAVLVTPSAVLAGFIPDGPQRPPRHLS